MKKPYVGMPIDDCYMNGIGTIDEMMVPGVVDGVGDNWMVVRTTSFMSTESRLIFIQESSYHNVDELNND